MGKVQEVISKYETGTLSNGTYQPGEAQNKTQTTLEQLLLSCDINTEYSSNNSEVSSSSSNSINVMTPQGYMNVRPVQASYPLTPLGSGGFIFNYSPLYSFTPISPFSQQVMVSAESSIPVSPPTSPPYPSSPNYSNFTSSPSSCDPNAFKRQEKLEKYRQKRGKRNWNRPVDQARRERAQHRVRDEHGHFVSSKSSSSSSSSSTSSSKHIIEEMNDVKNQLNEYRMESIELKNKLSAVEHQLEEQQRLNNALSAFLHENRVLYPTVPISDLFNTLNPNHAYADAFKEKIDFSAIDLHWTESPYSQKDSSSQFLLIDPPSLS